MPVEDLMWVEKYRPHALEDVINQSEVKERLRPLLEKKQEMPHLLFAGPPGTGKTTVAQIVAERILGDLKSDYTLSLNASDERGINTVRERVKVFASYSDRREGVPFRLVILDEADEMCLDPETRVITGRLDHLKEMSLLDLLDTYGKSPFDLPSFGSKGMRLENDRGRIVQSGTAFLYRIRFADGRSVKASAEHPFFAIEGRSIRTVRTRDLIPGTEVAEFSDRVLRCYNCSRPFFRPYRFAAALRHFCSTRCRNVYLASFSLNRTTTEEKRMIGIRATHAMARLGVYGSREYRRRRSETASRLVRQERIPDPRTWTKFKPGEGHWVRKRLSGEHGRATGRQPEAKNNRMAAMVSKSLANPDGKYRRVVESGSFRQASRRAYMASLDYWKQNNFRTKAEKRMAQLLDKWNIPYTRDRLICTSPAGKKSPFTVDFVIREKIALFVNGCWWHVCPTCGVKPRYEKQFRNMEKDYRHIEELEASGYKAIVVWEHELRDDDCIKQDVLPKVLESVGVAGGGPARVLHTAVDSIEPIGASRVLNISMTGNQNFLLANGILTHNTRDAQTALRRIMEESSRFTRFILIANYSSGIIEPIQSRCAIFRFQRVGSEEVVGYLKKIAKSEKLRTTEKVLESVYEATNGDLRQAINLLQAAASDGEVTMERVNAVTGATVKERVAEIIGLALDGDFASARQKLVELTKVYGIPESDFLRFSNETITAGTSHMAEAIKILADYDYRLVMGANPEIQLTAMLAELAALKDE